MEERVYLDMLTQNNVDVRKQNIAIIDGKEYAVGDIYRKNYQNTERDRQEVLDEVPEPYSTAIFAVWGDTPTVIEATE
jgi:GTP-sensing pleiotropic transcriptional regulator CodY